MQPLRVALPQTVQKHPDLATPEKDPHSSPPQKGPLKLVPICPFAAMVQPLMLLLLQGASHQSLVHCHLTVCLSRRARGVELAAVLQ